MRGNNEGAWLASYGLMLITCADPESFVRRGPTLTTFFFLVDKGMEDSTTISGLSSARQRNAIKWRFAGVQMIAKH